MTKAGAVLGAVLVFWFFRKNPPISEGHIVAGSKSLNDLRPKVKTLAIAFIAACKNAGVPVLIYATLRTVPEQNTLYARGRTTAGKIVTNAKGGDSWHNYGLAFDFVPLDKNGAADWSNREAYAKCGAIGEALGLEWGGRFKMVDMPHLQYTGGLKIADMKAGRGANVGVA